MDEYDKERGRCSLCSAVIYRKQMWRYKRTSLPQALCLVDEPDFDIPLNYEREPFFEYYNSQGQQITTCPGCWVRIR